VLLIPRLAAGESHDTDQTPVVEGPEEVMVLARRECPGGLDDIRLVIGERTESWWRFLERSPANSMVLGGVRGN
jgi:hypothetical protein